MAKLGIAVAFVWVAAACAQVPDTRAGEIESERDRKAADVEPDTPTRPEQVLDEIEDRKIIERLTCQLDGLCVRFGGLITYSGFALGPEYIRHGLLGGKANFFGSVRGSTQLFWLAETGLDMPRLADGLAFLELYAVHHYDPHIDYYGPGPNSKKTGRSGYLLEDTSFEVTPGIRPTEHLRIGGIGRYVLNNVGAGRDPRFASTDQLFTEQTTPGIQFQTDFLQSGGFVQYDWRDNPGGPRRGGNYIARFTNYDDLRRGRYSFNRVDLEAQQYFSFFNQRRVIALRGRIEATDPLAGNVVPFYLQPTVGGPDDLRGFRPFRFYDNNALVLNGEYRWEVFSGLDMALFVDAGRVYHDWHQIDLQHLEADAGFGFRFNVRNDVFMRIDTGFSREGFQVWLKFGNVF